MHNSHLLFSVWPDSGADIVQWLMKNLSIEDPGKFLKNNTGLYCAECNDFVEGNNLLWQRNPLELQSFIYWKTCKYVIPIIHKNLQGAAV